MIETTLANDWPDAPDLRERVRTTLERLSRTGALPTLAPAATAALAIARDPNGNVAKLCRIIRGDLGLTARVLRMANSAALARRTATRTLEDAVMALGLRKTCDILVGVCARQLYVGPNALVRDLWDHAVTVGVAAEELAVFTRRVDAGLAFLPGLFHDVGRIAFLLADAPTFEVVHAVATNGVEPAIEVERQWYGFHHGECGAVLVEDWGLTLAQADAIRWHHDPVTAAKEAANPVDALAAIVAAADALAHRLAADDTAGADGALCTALGLSTDDETTCLDRIRASLAAYRELLG